MLKIGFFCRTYYRDAERLNFLLRSIERYAIGFAGITVACPSESIPAIEAVTRQFSFATLVECNGSENDFIGQQITKMSADLYADYDVISHIDSDCVIYKELSSYALIEEGRPIMYMAPYDYFHNNGINMPWQRVTSRYFGKLVEWEFMRQFPLSYPRTLYPDLRQWFEVQNGYNVSDIDKRIEGDEFSEFNLMGAFSFYSNKHYHVFKNVIEEPSERWVEQFCLFNSRDDRSMIEKEREDIQKLINGPAEKDVDNRNILISQPPNNEGADPASGAHQEMQAFKNANLWSDGYIDADPLRPVSWSSYTTNGFVSVYHAAYLAGIKPYVDSKSTVLEIGPGRGAWTRAILLCGAQKVITLDVQPRSKNGIDQFLGPLSERLDYIEVEDFSMRAVEDDSIDFFWSFGTFVHLSKHAQSAYISSLFLKMKSGAHGFIQFADMDKWNAVVQDKQYMIHEIISNFIPEKDAVAVKTILENSDAIKSRETIPEHVRSFNDVDPGRYFYVGADWLSDTLTSAGFVIRDKDVMPSLRDPLIHFSKPA